MKIKRLFDSLSNSNIEKIKVYLANHRVVLRPESSMLVAEISELIILLAETQTHPAEDLNLVS